MNNYANHLASLGQTMEIRLTDKLVNQDGVLLASSGTLVDNRLAERIHHHTLQQPLADLVALSNQLTGDDLMSDLIYGRKHPMIQQFMSDPIDKEILKVEISKLNEIPVLLKHLTVLKHRLPSHYDNAIVGAYLAILFCREAGLSAESRHIAFFAALCRDLGYLQLPPELSDSTQKLSAEQWKLLQTHPSISRRMVDSIPHLNDDIAKAVEEHHERFDGLGYPNNTIGKKLGVAGQVISFADLSIALFQRYVAKGVCSVHQLVPIFNVNAQLYHPAVATAAIRAIKNAFFGISSQTKTDQCLSVEDLLKKQSYLGTLFKLSIETLSLVEQLDNPSLSFGAKAFLVRMRHLLATSGLTDVAYLEHLRSLLSKPLDDSDLQELMQFQLMMSEAFWQFQFTIRYLSVEGKPLLEKAALDEDVQGRLALMRRLARSMELIEPKPSDSHH